jgi:ATP-dependent DNA ligase
MEGSWAKRPIPFTAGRETATGIKLKCGKRQEFIVAGYTQSDKKARGDQLASPRRL